MKRIIGILMVLFLLVAVGTLYAGGKQEGGAEAEGPIENVRDTGDFEGITVKAKLIGGAQYEMLYEGQGRRGERFLLGLAEIENLPTTPTQA